MTSCCEAVLVHYCTETTRRGRRTKTYAELGLVVAGNVKGLVGHGHVGTHLVEGVVRDGEPQLLLGLGQPHPELAPGAGTRAEKMVIISCEAYLVLRGV